MSEAKEQNRLKEVLKEKKISAYKLAIECHIATPDMYMALNGKKPMYSKWKTKIAEYLKMSEEEIFSDYEMTCCKSLKDYTTDELLTEIKRRIKAS